MPGGFGFPSGSSGGAQEGDRGKIVIEAVDKDNRFMNFLTITGSVLGPDNKPISVRPVQVAPGRYEAEFPTLVPGSYVVARLKNGVCVLAVSDDGTAYLTEEFHYGVGRVTLEAVSGGIDADENTLATAKRELKEEIGLEAHPHLDQFIRIEQGTARVELGRTKERVDETHDVEDDWALVIPAGTWHNVINTGDGDLRLYSLYSPPEHPDGTVHLTKADADAAEHDH